VPVAIVELGAPYLVDSDGRAFKRVMDDEDGAAELPRITGLDRAAYLADPGDVAAQIRSALRALASWRDGSDERPAIATIHLDARGELALRTAGSDTEIELGAMDDGLAARMHTFDAVWASLDDAQRDNARAMHLDSGSSHVTIAFR
jgi:hypothetical protein